MSGISEKRLAATQARLAALPAPMGESQWARSAREAARQRLVDLGLPERRDEYWRFTDPAQVLAASETATSVDFALDDAQRIDMAAIAPCDGVEVAPLSEVLRRDIHWGEALFGHLEAAGHEPVPRTQACLTTYAAVDGVALRLRSGQARIILDHSGLPAGGLTHSIVQVEAGAELTLIERGNPRAGGISTLEARLGAGARLHHIRLQDGLSTGIANAFVEIGAGAEYRGFAIGANGQALRNESQLTLLGPEAKAHIGGAFIGKGAVHHDDTVFITHGAPNCESRQVFRSVLGRGATAAFQGKILVRQVAQKTDGYQLSQALLLDDDAQFLGKPELEIYADDVKCSHGSTTGSIDETALFYLRSRGVPESAARHMLVLAFLNETLDEIADDALRAMLTARVEALAERALG